MNRPRPPAPLAVAFQEVRHFQPDDCLHVEAVSVRGRLHGWTIPAHRHDGLHQFQWLHKGRAEVTLDGRTVTVEAPAVLMLAPGCVHGFVYAPEVQGQQVSVPTPTLVKSFSSASTLAARLAVSAVIELGSAEPDRAEIESLFRQIAVEFERDAPGRVEALQSMALLIALWFLRHPTVHGVQPAGVRDTLVQRFRAIARRHHREHRPLAFYAEALKVTPDHLSRACRAVTGLSALNLLHECVLVEARRLLAFTELPVADVATALGYEDAPYFSRFFARRSGMAPSQYRQRAAEGRVTPPAAM